MGAVSQLAAELGAPERSLRRAVNLGSIRARQLGERRLRVERAEFEYLLGHWALLAELRRALRNEHRVRTAALVGSMARGDDGALSDVDLVVSLGAGEPLDRQRLGMRLGSKIGCHVDVADLDLIERDDPLSLLQVLDEGRPIVDRDGRWRQLRQRRPAIYQRAMRSYRRQLMETAPLLGRLALSG